MGTEDSRNSEAERILEQLNAAIREEDSRFEVERLRAEYQGALAVARRPSDR